MAANVFCRKDNEHLLSLFLIQGHEKVEKYNFNFYLNRIKLEWLPI